MKLVEIIAVIVLTSLLSPVFVSVIVPMRKIYRETTTLKMELEANQFISESFCSLARSGVYGTNFNEWQSLVPLITGCEVTIEKVRGDNEKIVYRASWVNNNKPLFVDAEFSLGGSYAY
jgi:hypothetical protein